MEITMINTGLYLVKTPWFRLMSSAYFSWNSTQLFQTIAGYPCVSPHIYLSVLMSFINCGVRGPYLFILPYLFSLLPFSCRRLINRTKQREMKGKKRTEEGETREGERHKIIWSHLNFFLIMLSNFNMQT